MDRDRENPVTESGSFVLIALCLKVSTKSLDSN